MSKEIKVTDKRIFTSDGELREEYRHLQKEGSDETPEPETRPEPARPPVAPSVAEPATGAVDPPALEIPGTPPELGGPSFYDLVALIAEPVSLYLGDIELPDGGSAENMDMARLHIDLLDVLRQKTAGRLTAQESAVLEDVLYRLRMRYVQKRG